MSQHNCKNCFGHLCSRQWQSCERWQEHDSNTNRRRCASAAVFCSTCVFCNADPGLRLAAVNPFARRRGSLCPGWELVFGEGDLPASTDNVLLNQPKTVCRHALSISMALSKPSLCLHRLFSESMGKPLIWNYGKQLLTDGVFWGDTEQSVCLSAHLTRNLCVCTFVEKREMEAESKSKKKKTFSFSH